MQILKKRGIKLMLMCCIITVVIMCALSATITWVQYNQYKSEINQTIANIVGNIKNKYPDVEESEIIKILNAKGVNTSIGEETLQKYGINTNTISSIYSLDSIFNKQVHQNILICIFFAVLLCFIFIVYIKKRDKKLDEILEYIKEINQKNYSLKINENTEDDLSSLRNELYKITVMLKEQADKEKADRETIQTSVSDISHQIKTPITSISIMLDNIAENPDMSKDTRNKFIYEIRRQIDQISWLITALLKLSRLDADTVRFKQEEIIVEDFIKEIKKNLSISLEVKNQNIIIKGDKNAKFIADRSWQLEAITNIVKNCIEHTPENKNIYISFEENSFYTKIDIQDEGDGIPKQDINHIFERFYKGKNSSDNSIGIGLALAKTIIEKQNGFIKVNSEEGNGAIFEIKYMKN